VDPFEMSVSNFLFGRYSSVMISCLNRTKPVGDDQEGRVKQCLIHNWKEQSQKNKVLKANCQKPLSCLTAVNVWLTVFPLEW